jgi:thiol-disulfide isomerase/thioredoxin
MKKVIKTTIILSAMFLVCGFVLAQETSKKIEMNFFFSPTCSHCKAEEAFIPSLQSKYPELELKSFDVTDKSNVDLLIQYYRSYSIPKEKQGSVPVTFIGNKYFIGFNDEIGKNIDDAIKNFAENGIQKPELEPKPITVKNSSNLLIILSSFLILVFGFVAFNLIWTRRQKR